VNLEFATDDELVNELVSRFDHFVLAGRRDNKEEGKYTQRWAGDPHVAMGLIVSCAFDVKEHLNEQDKPGGTDGGA